MITMNSISGGTTSAYMMMHYPADYNVFALVRTNDVKCKFPDKKIRQMVSDRIGTEFVGTLEFDEIIYTMLDLEQLAGQKISWVTSMTFDELVKKKGMHLPNPTRRFCTEILKVGAIFEFWNSKNIEPWEARIGFRANETRRVYRMKQKLTDDGFQLHSRKIGVWADGNNKGKNKWESIKWQKPIFPLHDIKQTYKDEILQYWKDKAVRFAPVNNCVGCFHKSPASLSVMNKLAPNKFRWFRDIEEEVLQNPRKLGWHKNRRYSDIEKLSFTLEINFDDLSSCDNGYCGL